jgi:lycopene beta-cyclase
MSDAAPLHDIAIIGGGLAGLSLAVRLARPQFRHLNVLLIEPRRSYARDHTWSCWSVRDHPFTGITKSWESWIVASGTRMVKQSAPGITYGAIQADDFYALAEKLLAEAPWITRRTLLIDRLDEQPDRVGIGDNTALQARHVFDSRPPRQTSRSGLRQIFLGQEIETERDIFDPASATLMDFRVSHGPATASTGVHFMYVLPYTPRRALVEDTWFVRPGITPPDHRPAITAYLAERHKLANHAVTFEEQGDLPMDPDFTPPPEARASRIHPIGAPSGALRPATGYAFLAIQAQCDGIAAALAADTPLHTTIRRPVTVQGMDRLLLASLRRAPAQAPEIFSRLFSRCPPAMLVRFLSDRGSRLDDAFVAVNTPLRTIRPLLTPVRA